MKRTIIVTIRVSGFHAWPSAPEDISFLRQRHRHLFTFRAEFKVGEQTREVEFFQAQRRLRSHLAERYSYDVDGFEFGARGCEDIASELAVRLDLAACEVWEDSENGARVER